MEINSGDYEKWIGKSESTTDELTLSPLNAMAATMDKNLTNFQPGDKIPDLWHWLFFLEPAPQAKIAKDGHPKRGEFLPPIPLPRRMWAGSRFDFIRPLRAGERVERNSIIKNVEIKEGRSGVLAFVSVLHEISDDTGIALSEEHNIVYRDNPSSKPSSPFTKKAPNNSDYSRYITPDPVFLFRYSALTFNGHRIHYDREYVTKEEGYPGLIVHGPLLATLLIDSFAEQQPKFKITKFNFKAIHPVFDLHPFKVCGLNPNSENKASLWIEDHKGNLCMQSEIFGEE